ncbi:MAG: sialic acid O-acetyltransferase [Bacteroidales bacterium]|nr:sialic acid O-acetyltransferase [Bacteroidales bacterium]
MNTEDIIVVGAVGSALNIAEQINNAFENFNHYQRVVGFCIDSFPVGSIINQIPVVCITSNISEYLGQNRQLKVIYNLFRPDVLKERYELFQKLNIPLSRLTNFIHPSAYVASSSVLGVGNVVMSNVSIQSNVRIQNFNIINSNVTIEHDTFFGNGNFIAANVAIGAKVNLGSHNFIGLNSSVREGVSLDSVFVGMHSLVLTSYKNSTIYGVPACKNE